MALNENSIRKNLPNKWIWTKLKEHVDNPKNDIVDGPFGSNLKASEYLEYGTPIIRLQNIKRNEFIEKNIKYISKKKGEELIRHNFIPGDLVITKLGDPLGKTCIVPDYMDKGIIVADVVRVRINPKKIVKNFLVFALNSEIVSKQLNEKTKGTTRPRVNLDHLRNIFIPTPKIIEQNELVKKIEVLFEKLDSGVEGLEKVKKQIKRYRQAVLKAAFNGELTKKWREKVLSDELRVLSEEQKELKKYKIDDHDLPELPIYWMWAYIDRLVKPGKNSIKAGPFGSSLKKSMYTKKGFKIYGQEQVIREDPYYGDYFIDKSKYQSLISCSVKPRDVLISLVGTIGKVLILPHDVIPGIINPRLVKFSLNENVIISEYFKFYIESNTVKHFFKLASHGGTMDILNLKIIKNIPITVPPIEEQQKIVEEIEKRFEVADEVEKFVDESLKKAKQLRQSILREAFNGNLTKKWREEHPELITGENSARALLEKIKKEKEKNI